MSDRDPRDIAALELCRQLDEKDREIGRYREALTKIRLALADRNDTEADVIAWRALDD